MVNRPDRLSEYSSTVNELKPMADENEVAPQIAEENTEVEDTNAVTIGDVAQAAGLESFFENASNDESDEESLETEEVEEEEEPTEDRREPEETSEDSDGVKKRIGKLIEARNKALEEAEELRVKLKENEAKPEPAQVPEQKGLDRFDNVTTIEELKTREQEAEHLREWLLENPEGGEYTDIAGEEHDVDYEQARQLTVATDRDLRKNIPTVARKIADRENNTRQAYQIFDWMKDPASPESIEIQNVLKQNPIIADYYKKDPFAVLTVGYAIEGIKAINAKIQKRPTQQAQAPKVPAAPSRATPKVVKGKGKDKKALLQKAMSGEVNDAASYIESLL